MDIREQITGLGHIGIPVRNIDDTVAFYQMIGFHTIHRLPFWKNGVRYFTIEGPNGEKIEFSQYL